MFANEISLPACSAELILLPEETGLKKKPDRNVILLVLYSVYYLSGYLSVGSSGLEQTPIRENTGRYETRSEVGVITFSCVR